MFARKGRSRRRVTQANVSILGSDLSLRTREAANRGVHVLAHDLPGGKGTASAHLKCSLSLSKHLLLGPHFPRHSLSQRTPFPAPGHPRLHLPTVHSIYNPSPNRLQYTIATAATTTTPKSSLCMEHHKTPDIPASYYRTQRSQHAPFTCWGTQLCLASSRLALPHSSTGRKLSRDPSVPGTKWRVESREPRPFCGGDVAHCYLVPLICSLPL